MSRPRMYGDRVSTQVRIPVDVHARLVDAAAERDLTVNWLVTRAIEEYLARLIPVGEIKWTRDA